MDQKALSHVFNQKSSTLRKLEIELVIIKVLYIYGSTNNDRQA